MLAVSNSSSTDCSEATSPGLKIERSSHAVLSGSRPGGGGGVAVGVKMEQEMRSRHRPRKEAKNRFMKYSFVKNPMPFAALVQESAHPSRSISSNVRVHVPADAVLRHSLFPASRVWRARC